MTSILVALLMSHAFAGTSIAGDGDLAITCDDQVQILDYAEAKANLGLTDLELSETLFIERTRELRFRFPADEVLKAYRDFEVRHIFHLERLPAYSNDCNRRWLANQFPFCVVSQLALLEWDAGLVNPRLHVDYFLFDQLGANSQAAFFFHEALHKFFTTETRDSNIREPAAASLRQFIIYLSAPDEFRRMNADLARKIFESKQPVPWSAWRR